MSQVMSNVKQWVGTITATSAMGDECEMTVSTGNLDRQNDRVIPGGADLSGFMRNPTLLWAHDYSQIPIGSVTALDVGPSGIRARWRWNEQDELGARVKRAWDGGFIRGASIGFQPLEFERNPEGGLDYTRWSLLEISLAPVPANAEAVRAFKHLKLWPEKTGLGVDWAGYQKWFESSPAPGGTRQNERRTPVDQEFEKMDQRHAVIQMASDAWDRVDPRHAGAGTVVARPDLASLDAGFIPKECRGGAGLNPAQRAVFDAQLVFARTGGAARAHRGNLTGGGGIDIDPGTVTEVVRGIVAKLMQGLGPKIDQQVRAALARARGRID